MPGQSVECLLYMGALRHLSVRDLPEFSAMPSEKRFHEASPAANPLAELQKRSVDLHPRLAGKSIVTAGKMCTGPIRLINVHGFNQKDRRSACLR